MPTVIRFERVTKHFDAVIAVDGVDLEVRSSAGRSA